MNNTPPQHPSPADQPDADDVEQHACPKCEAQPGSPCRSRGGAVASAYHTRRFTLVRSLGFVSARHLHEYRPVTVEPPTSLTSSTVNPDPETDTDLHQHADPHCLSLHCHQTERSQPGQPESKIACVNAHAHDSQEPSGKAPHSSSPVTA
ncbi:zinc finger domain-containing protein [Streptomyces sp. NPDC004126]|uniref:zinc finger domain-containing protein n=1 Tax=Streptomyces sp. NPDC004126 TaxID=3390695 RepID=UPI003CFDEB9C